jgi:hypothetical protein
VSAAHTSGLLRTVTPEERFAITGLVPVENGSEWSGNGGLWVAGCTGPDRYANARRLVACWNACDGVPTEVLEAQQAGGLPWSVADQIEHGLKRDKLLDALKRIASTVPAIGDGGGFVVDHHSPDGEYLGTENVDPMWVIQEMASIALAAVAKAEGGAL